MNSLPSFETARLILRQRTMEDLGDCLAMDRDPAVTKFIPGPWNEPDEHRQFVRGRIEAEFGDGLGYWSIFEKQNPEKFLGWILLIPADGKGPDIEIGWRLNRLAWGNGYATEAATPILRHGFETLNLKQVIAEIAPKNVASIRVAEKLGLAVAHETDYLGVPFTCHAITREEFAKSFSITTA